jgi:hypothetical protein
MRQILISVVLTSLLHTAASAQTRADAKALEPCALLTSELVRKVGEASKKSTDAATPREMKLGATGVACHWGEILLQVDPLTRAQLEQLGRKGDKTWESVSGVGDDAYFHNISDVMGELFVRVGPRTFGVLIDIPAGSTASAFKPTFITVANAVVPKLR